MQFRTATVLGLIGLLPFFAFTIFILVYPHNEAVLQGFETYVVIVLSFLGGLHWGLLAGMRSVAQNEPLKAYWIWGGIPPVLGWVILYWPPLWFGFAVLMVAYVLQYIIDVRLVKLNIFPYWLLQLRRILTALAVLCLLIVLLRLWHLSHSLSAMP